MNFRRLLLVVASMFVLLVVTLTHTGAARSARRPLNGPPALSVVPTSVVVLAQVNTPTLQTHSMLIANTVASTTLTWTIALNTQSPLSITVSPLTGTNNATVTIDIDTAALTTTGLYTAELLITTEPTDTLNSPVSVPITVSAVEQIRWLYLPLLAKNYAVPTAPITLRFGVAHVSAPEWFAAEERYQRAAAVGAQINRWPMYWPNIEHDAVNQPRVYDWGAQDANIVKDVQHNLTSLPILLFTPGGLDTGGNRAAPWPTVGGASSQRAALRPDQISSVTSPPQSLGQPVFTDGTDTPGVGKSINPANRWAHFVYEAVSRYAPGGTLAQQQGWGADKGIRAWEVWNEPDLDQFFSGTATDYARLLKVAYVAAKFADPQTTVVFGGLVHWQKPNWFGDVLTAIAANADAAANHYFMDAVASHNYAWAWRTFWYLLGNRTALDARGLTNVGLWLTETGVSTCGDPADFGQDCNDPVNSVYRATPGEQADYLIQSATFAAWLKAQVFIWFQLYDDAGNGCPSRDGFGLLRNPASGPCYVGDGQPRPAYTSYQIIAKTLADVEPYWRKRPTVNQEIIAFKRPFTGERVVVMWNRYYTTTETVILTATAASAVLLYPDGATQPVVPISGTYTIDLPPATNDNTPTTDGKAPIGGPPRILIEYDPAVKP